MPFKIGILGLLAVISGILYAIGGKGGFKGAKLIRRLACPLCFLLAFWGLAGFKIGYIWLYLATFGLSVGAMSSYWSIIQKPEDDVSALEWFVTGLIYGLSAFPLIWCGVHWYSIVIRVVILGLLTMLWSVNIGQARAEEFGRGALYIITLSILL